MINVSKPVFLPINFYKEELEQARNITHKGTTVVKERLTVTGIEIGAVNETIMTAPRKKPDRMGQTQAILSDNKRFDLQNNHQTVKMRYSTRSLLQLPGMEY